MAHLGLLNVYDMKRANTRTIRKRCPERRKIGRNVAIFVAAALLAVSWLTVGFRCGMMRNSEMRLHDTLSVDFGEAEPWKRKLSASTICDNAMGLKGYQVGLQTVGLFYLFLGLAVVCDEYFQMALEAISMSLKLTPDVAGATFLAAGSSAPELFTALSDTFASKNSIGTGTIVGSAIFNILVIVALSAIVAGKGGVWLDVDWRPICRDVCFYSYSIGLLVIVFLDYSISLWECCTMVGSYFVYVLFMKYNAHILGKCKSHKVDDISNDRSAVERAEMVLGSIPPHRLGSIPPRRGSGMSESGFNTTRRASLQTMGVRYRHSSFGSDHPSPLRRVSQTMGVRYRHDKYRRAWRRAIVKVIAVQKFSLPRSWERFDVSNTSAEPANTSADIEKGISKVEDKGVQNDLSYVSDHNTSEVLQQGSFDTTVSLVSEGGKQQERKKGGEEEETNDEEQSRFNWPDSCFDRTIFVLSIPFLVVFAITIPDCGKESKTYWICGKRIAINWPNLYMVTFFISILWIAALTHYMVTWASNLGCKLQINPVIMGVILLAAGTSVPDAIGSMIAARDGEANMAIANAIGSNVFDILLGLGIPWVLSNIYYGEPVDIVKDGLEVNIIILACTVVLFIGVLAWNRWCINTKVGLVLFGLYFAFLIYSVVSAVLLD